MPRARAHGIEIEYEEFGDRGAPPLLLIMGLGAQMTAWPEAFCRRVAERGFHVIRFDNRDIGLSTKFEAAGTPELAALMAKLQQGRAIEAPYTLWDMAADAAGLLDALGIAAAHIVGASMGGMIAQAFAITYPKRTLSLTSIMSTTSEPDLPQAKPEAMGALMAPRPTERAGIIAAAVQASRVLSGGGFEVDEAELRRQAEESYERSYYPQEMLRQLVAILASGGRREALRRIRVPSIVIHGDSDPLVPHECGVDTHAAIEGAELVTIPGMGHEMPQGAWPAIIDAIERVTRKAAVAS
jgi:pimeloyl-ACP methyl ester carboxylesterase